MEISIVFPHQLYKQHPALQKGRQVFLVEEWLYFNQYQFHKQKLILHRASMQFYKQYLTQQGFEVDYIEAIDVNNDVRKLIEHLAEQKITTVHFVDVVDNWLDKRLVQTANNTGIKLGVLYLTNLMPVFLAVCTNFLSSQLSTTSTKCTVVIFFSAKCAISFLTSLFTSIDSI